MRIKILHTTDLQMLMYSILKLPKLGVASSSLVYRSFENQVVILNKLPDFFIFQASFFHGFTYYRSKPKLNIL